MVWAFDHPIALDGDPAPVIIAPGIAVADSARDEVGRVYWWHWCNMIVEGVEAGWVLAGCGKHAVTGSVAGGDLTLSPSIMCLNCGKHGFVSNQTWREC